MRAAHRCVLGGLTGLALVSATIIYLVFDIVLGPGTPGTLIAAAAVALAFISLWAAVPYLMRGREG